MSAVAELTRALIASGMDIADAAALVARAGAEMCSVGPSKAALRTRKWRANKPSQTVTERHPVTASSSGSEPSPNVTNRHRTSPGDGAHISISPEPSSKDSVKEEGRIEAPRTKKASRISAGWQIDQRHIDYAISKGIAPERIPILGEKFKTHWLAASGKGSVSPNWFLKWCTWVMNEVEWNGTANGTNRQTGSGARGAGFSGLALQRARAASDHH